MSRNIAQLFSRVLIGLELGIGIAFLLPLSRPFSSNSFGLRKVTIPVALGITALFSFYLIWLMSKGNFGDCGCFGKHMPMGPVGAFVKNILIIAMGIFIFKFLQDKPKDIPYLPIILFLLCPVLIFAIKSPNIKKEKPPEYVKNLPKAPDDIKFYTKFSKGAIEPLKGQKLFAFLSADCDHCKDVARELNTLGVECHLIMLTNDGNEEIFFAETAVEFPYYIEDDPGRFFNIVDPSPPYILLLYDGGVVGKWNQETFKIDEVKKLLE